MLRFLRNNKAQNKTAADLAVTRRKVKAYLVILKSFDTSTKTIVVIKTTILVNPIRWGHIFFFSKGIIKSCPIFKT